MRAPASNRFVRRRATLLALFLVIVPWTTLPAEEPPPLPPAWACLPEPTLAVLRLPSLAAFAHALVKQTRWGAAMNEPQRWKSALEFLAQQHGTELAELERKLAAYDLKMDDWRTLASGEMGYAVIGDEVYTAAAEGKTFDANAELQLTFAGWFEPGDELGGRLWKAWDRWTAEAVAEHASWKRVDESLGDTPVIRLSVPEVALPHSALSFGAGFTGRGLTFSVEIRPEKKKDGKKIHPRSEYHLLVARAGSRFLLVHNFPGECEDAETAQSDSVASLEACRQRMTQILERHRRLGEPSGWLGEAIDRTSRDGTPLFELYGNAGPVLKAELAAMEGDGDGKEPASDFIQEIRRFIRASLAVKTIVVRGSLQQNRWERTIHVGLPPDRAGLLSLFDVGSLPAEPAAWVPVTAQSYSQINLDATPIAERMRELFQGARKDPDLGGPLALIEGQWHVDLEGLIGGLGPRMIFVEFADPPEGKQRVGPADAVLWQVRNDEPWQKALAAAAGSFGQKLIERDGYVGLQIPLFGSGKKSKELEKSMPWLLAGHGHLLWVTGEDPTGPPLTRLPEPATAGDSFRESRTCRRAAELFPGDTCFAFQCIDRSPQAETANWLYGWIRQLSKLQLIPNHASDGKKGAVRAWSQEWWSRLLGDEVDEPLLTVEADRLTIEPDGAVHRSVLEFVPPEQ